MLIRNKHCEQFDSFIESVQILPCPQLGKFIKKSYMWDPTSGQATRPLAMFNSNSKTLSDARLRDVNFRDVRFDVMLDNSQNIHYYTHDANKNVTELISDSGDISAHYEYSPFGATIASSGDLSYSNPFQFSSEFSDRPLGLIYYNYRHYNPLDGRWISRDPTEERGGWNLYGIVANDIINKIDFLGEKIVRENIYSLPHYVPNANGGDVRVILKGILTLSCDCAKDENGNGKIEDQGPPEFSLYTQDSYVKITKGGYNITFTIHGKPRYTVTELKKCSVTYQYRIIILPRYKARGGAPEVDIEKIDLIFFEGAITCSI